MEKNYCVQKKTQCTGFTLIEIIIVVALVMFVGSVAVPVGITQINRSVCRDRYDEVRSELVRVRTKALTEGTSEHVNVESGVDAVRVSSSGPVVFDGLALSRVPPLFQPAVTIRFEGAVCDRSIIINEVGAII